MKKERSKRTLRTIFFMQRASLFSATACQQEPKAPEPKWENYRRQVIEQFPVLDEFMPAEQPTFAVFRGDESTLEDVINPYPNAFPNEKTLDRHVYCIYGLRSLAFFPIERHKQALMIIEDDLQQLADFFLKQPSPCLEMTPKIYFVETPLLIEKTAYEIALKSLFREVHFVATPRDKLKPIFEELQRWVVYHKGGMELVFAEVKDRGVALVRAILSNLLTASDVYEPSSLKNQFKKVPAIICGAGPSLKQHLSSLASLQDRALLFAGGHALSILQNGEITPQFGMMIDPESSYRICKEVALDLPALCYQARVAEGTPLLTGVRTFLFPEHPEFFFSKWLSCHVFSGEESWNGGWTVSNFLTRLALFLGCDPIIFVGMDMAFTEGERYSQGSSQDSSSLFKQQESLVETVDILGKPVTTRGDWLLSAQWTAHLARHFKEHRFINATEGGIGFGKEIENIPLKSVLETYLGEQKDLQAMVHLCLANASNYSLSHLRKAVSLLHESCRRCCALCQKFLENPQNMYDASQLTLGVRKALDTLMQEEFYVSVLGPVWDRWKEVLMEHRDESASKIPVQLKEGVHRLIFCYETTRSYDELFCALP